jgi:hypothetical protein
VLKIPLKEAAEMADRKQGGLEMRRLMNIKRATKSKPVVHSAPDPHKWATKMEIHRLMSGKPDLKIKPAPKPTS